MPDGPVPFHGRRALRAAVAHPRHPSTATTLLPGDLADLLLDGEHSPHPVAALLAAARGPATAHELSGEAAARQAFADAAPLAVPVPLPTDRERRGRHRRMRAVRTVVTAKVVGVAALTLTAGGVAVAATGPSGAPAEEHLSGGDVPSADADPGTDHTAGRSPGAGHPAGSAGRAEACGPVTGAAIADLARDCGAPRDGGDGPDGHRVGPGTMAYGSPYGGVPPGDTAQGGAAQDAATRGGQDTALTTPPATAPPAEPPTTAPPSTVPPSTVPPSTGTPTSGTPTSGPPASGPPAQAGADGGSGTPGSEQGSAASPGSDGGGPRHRTHTRDDAPPRRDAGTTDPTPAGAARTPVTGRGAPTSP